MRRSVRFPLVVQLKPSRFAIGLSAAIHSIAAFAFLASSLHPAVMILAAALLVLSHWRVMVGERGRRDVVLTLQPDGALHLGLQDGEVHALPQATSADFGWALWLHWEGSRYRNARRRTLRGALMLLPDGVDEEVWRELRIWFRHVAKPALSASGTRATER